MVLLQVFLVLLVGGAVATTATPSSPERTSPTDRCQLPPEVGPCRAAIPRWWFNSSLGLCQGFIFGGCNGNKNNFQSERECQQSCAPSSPRLRLDSSYAAYCAMPPDTGPCRAAFPRWFFDAASSSCQQFIYGGCRGNSNNYDSEAECRSHCVTARDAGLSFLSGKALVLGVLLALVAAALLGFGVDVALRRCRKESVAPDPDKEKLVVGGHIQTV